MLPCIKSTFSLHVIQVIYHNSQNKMNSYMMLHALHDGLRFKLQRDDLWPLKCTYPIHYTLCPPSRLDNLMQLSLEV